MRSVDLSRDASKFLKRVPPKHARQLAQKISALMEDPRPPDSKPLQGASHWLRADSGEYRIIYAFDEATLIVALIGKRNDDEVYRRFERKPK